MMGGGRGGVERFLPVMGGRELVPALERRIIGVC